MQSKCIKVVRYPASDWCEIVRIKRPLNVPGTYKTSKEKHEEFLQFYEMSRKDFNRYFISDTVDNWRNRLQKQSVNSEEYVKLLRERTLRRAVKESQHAVLSNRWDFWVTFTFSSSVVNRYDREECLKLFAQTVKKINRKFNSSLKYIIFPEKHTDGAWHLHGFLKDVPDDIIFINDHNCRDLKYFCDMGWVNAKKIRSALDDTVRKKKYYCMKYCVKALESLDSYSHLYFKSNDLDEADFEIYYKELEKDYYNFLVLENAYKHSKLFVNDFVCISNMKLSTLEVLEEFYRDDIYKKYSTFEKEIGQW
jgi:hypothetical protein